MERFSFLKRLKYRKKKVKLFIENNLTYKAPLVGSRSNRFWMDLKKFSQ